jgi:preprotein translocase subunit SecE
MAAETTAVSKTDQKSGIASWPSQISEYFDGLRSEMKRVTWPGQAQVKATTAAVIVCVFLFAGYFAVIDTVLGRTVNQIFKSLVKR